MSKTFMTNEDMAVIDSKVDKLLQNASFRIECGVLRKDNWENHVSVNDTGRFEISIPCSANPKLIIFKATQATQTILANLTTSAVEDPGYTFALIFNNISDIDQGGAQASVGLNVIQYVYVKYMTSYAIEDLVALKMHNMDSKPMATVASFYQGDDAEYEWTAYYWDE